MAIMKLLACLVAVATSGCSFEMKPLAAGYDPRTEPRCDTNGLAPTGDAVLALLMGVAVVTALATDPPPGEEDNDGEIIAGGTIGGIALGISAALGYSWHHDCQAAIKQWDQRQIEQDEHLHGGADVDREAEQHVEKEAAARRTYEREQQAAKLADAQTKPRGVFCASSPTVEAAGLCAREKLDCQRARAAALAAVADLTECTLVETAQCYDAGGMSWCEPTLAACTAQRTAVPGASDCREEK